MAILRSAARLAGNRLGALSLARTTKPFSPLLTTTRGFAMRSLPRMGHNLEDHYDIAEFVCRMHNPLGEYFIWFWLFVMAGAAFGPMMHSNYYFTGRFLPKDQGNTQLCDESW